MPAEESSGVIFAGQYSVRVAVTEAEDGQRTVGLTLREFGQPRIDCGPYPLPGRMSSDRPFIASRPPRDNRESRTDPSPRNSAGSLADGSGWEVVGEIHAPLVTEFHALVAACDSDDSREQLLAAYSAGRSDREAATSYEQGFADRIGLAPALSGGRWRYCVLRGVNGEGPFLTSDSERFLLAVRGSWDVAARRVIPRIGAVGRRLPSQALARAWAYGAGLAALPPEQR